MAQDDDVPRGSRASDSNTGWAGLRPLEDLPYDARLSPAKGPARDTRLTPVAGPVNERTRDLARIIGATRNLQDLEAINNVRELAELLTGSGPAARAASPFGPAVVDYLTLPNLSAGNLGPRRGGIGGLDWNQFGEGGQQDTRNPFGVGRLGLLADGQKGGDPRDGTVIVRHGDVYFLVPPTGGGEPQQPRGRDAGVDAGADAGVDAGHDAGVDAGHDAGVDAGHDAGVDGGMDAGAEPDAGLEEIFADPRTGAPLGGDFRYYYREGPTPSEDIWLMVPTFHPDAGTPANPDDASGPDYTGVTERIKARIPVVWSPAPRPGPNRVRSVDPNTAPPTTVGPRVVVGGLADEPLRRLRAQLSTRRLVQALIRMRSTVDPPRPVGAALGPKE